MAIGMGANLTVTIVAVVKGGMSFGSMRSDIQNLTKAVNGHTNDKAIHVDYRGLDDRYERKRTG